MDGDESPAAVSRSGLGDDPLGVLVAQQDIGDLGHVQAGRSCFLVPPCLQMPLCFLEKPKFLCFFAINWFQGKIMPHGQGS
jgi:hypothetical protein